MKFSTLYLEIGRYWERLHRISAVARFYLPNCMILLLQKSSLVRSWSVHQSVKHRKARMTTRAWKWPHKVYVTPSVTGFFRRVFLCALLSSRACNESKRPCLPIGYQTMGSWSRIFIVFFFCFVFSRKAVTLDDGKIQCTLSVYWGKYTGKGPNKKIAKATAAKLAIEGLKKKSSEENAAVYIRQFAEPHKHKTRKRKLNELFTGIPMKIHKCSSNQTE